METPGRVAVIGAGAFGRFCISVYQSAPDIEVVAAVDRDPAALDKIESPGIRKERNWQSVIERGDVEVVHLVTPPHVRTDITFAALDAGKSVFCEKPLALSLAAADDMIVSARRNRVALGVDYVMRHHPAYRLLEALADSGLWGHLRTFSLQNFAQAMPREHWFWNRERSGGIFVEHGVHFFDAYGRIAGLAEQVRGEIPRPEAVAATVWYGQDVVGRFYHEFAFPHAVERMTGTSVFERGWVEVEGWIPVALLAAALAPTTAVEDVVRGLGGVTVAQEGKVTTLEAHYPNREAQYAAAVLAGMREMIRAHRDPSFRLSVPIEDARSSLALALAAQQAAVDGTTVSLRSGPVP